MKILVTTFVLISTFVFTVRAEGYKIELEVENCNDSVVYLAYYYGGKQYYKDTAIRKSMGKYIIDGKKDLIGGVYSIIFQDTSYFEFLVDAQNISMSTNKDDYIANMKTKGSPSNDLFFDYLIFMKNQRDEADKLKSQLKTAKNSADSAKINEQVNNTYATIPNRRKEIIENHTDLFIAKLFNMMAEPEVPEAPVDENGKKDEDFAYKYFKSHYLDGIDWSDERVLHTPIFTNRIEYYMDKLTYQIPDSLTISVDYILNNALANEEVFKFCVITLLNKYANSKIMGMDAVYVHIVEGYYLTGMATWVDSADMFRFKERVKALKPTLIGNKAPNLILRSMEGGPVSLNSLDSKFTVIYFWDVDCSHCKKQTPKMKKVYDDYRNKNVMVYAVYTQHEEDKWKKYVDEKDLDWINVWDQFYSSDFRDQYDIQATPKIFLLDEDKKIIAKGIGPEQVGEIIDRTLEMEKKKSEG